MKKIKLITTLCIVAAASFLWGCGSGDTEETAETETEAVIELEKGAEEEEEQVIRMEIDGEILPVLPDVTTAADNAVLAPAYLRRGEKHAVVAALQNRLMQLGYMDNDEPTTYYGDATAEAVKKFQRQKKVAQDGICGTETWDLLFAADAPYYKVMKGDVGDDIRQIQERLYQLGYLLNRGDGDFGEATEAAVRKMQERNGISVDGAVGKESIALLYSDEIKPNLIGLGEQSDLVKKFQQRLVDLGYLREEADGNFGGATERAVREFQSRNDQVVDGFLGPDTRAALEDPNAKPFGLRLGDTSESVKEAQRRLIHYGYLASGLDKGYYGELTVAAVKQFQKQNNLTQDGTVGIQTMTKLLSSNAKKKPAEVPRVTQNTNTGSSSSGSGSSSGGSSSSGSSSAWVGSGGATVSGSAGNLIAIASSKLGCPYVWGSKGPNSFDCSGFVYWCLNQAGVGQSYLTSGGWRNPGRYQRVSSFDAIQAGDVVVVSGHVGIAAGGGTVIDASSSNGRVVHRSLSNWWRNNFIVAWRIFG